MAKRTNELNCRLFIVVLTFLEFCSSSDVTSRSPPVARSLEDIGNPRTDVGSCGRNNQPSYICDPDHVLSIGQDDALESQIMSIHSSTHCPCSDATCRSTSKSGYLIAIAMVNKMKLTDNPTGNNDPAHNGEHASRLDTVLSEARKLAFGLLKKWNLGRCNESILILFSRGDNVLYTVTDVVAGKKLTDDLIGEISMDVRSEFGQNVTSGFQKLLTEYKEVFDGMYKRKTNWEDNNMPKYYPIIGASGNSLSVYIYFYTLVTVVVTVLMQL